MKSQSIDTRIEEIITYHREQEANELKALLIELMEKVIGEDEECLEPVCPSNILRQEQRLRLKKMMGE